MILFENSQQQSSHFKSGFRYVPVSTVADQPRCDYLSLFQFTTDVENLTLIYKKWWLPEASKIETRSIIYQQPEISEHKLKGKMRERERERERERDRETETETERDRERQRQRETETETERAHHRINH